MRKPRVEPLSLPHLVARELSRIGYSHRDIKRIVAATGSILSASLRDGEYVRWPGVFSIVVARGSNRTFKSNLPHLKGKAYNIRGRARLIVYPERELKRHLKMNMIVRPPRWTERSDE